VHRQRNFPAYVGSASKTGKAQIEHMLLMRSAVASVGRPVEIVAGVNISITKTVDEPLALRT
jgi:hypothetical protein